MKITAETDKDRKSKLFWYFHTIGWLGYWLFNTAGYTDSLGFSWTNYLWLTLIHVQGFFVSLSMRYVYRRMNYIEYSVVKIAAVIIGVSFLFTHIWYLLDLGLDYLMVHFTASPALPVTFSSYLRVIIESTSILAIWSGLYFFVNFWLEWNAQKDIAERASLLAQSAQLKLLRYQINPHFLFNSFSSLRQLIRTDSKRAEEMLTMISEFFRYSLINKTEKEVPLSQELEAVGHYLNIEKIRYGDKLLVEYNIDPLAEDYPVPCFILHPLVDNAVKYGMKSGVLPLSVEISAEVKGDDLYISLTNSGKWEPAVSKIMQTQTGTGLRNVTARLKSFYPGRHSFNINKSEDQVQITFSIKKEPEENKNEKV